MTSKAYAQTDLEMGGVRVAVIREGNSSRMALHFGRIEVRPLTEQDAMTTPLDDTWLRLPEDDARAIYEALADHFGHAGHDIRALRRDHDAERRRVDKLIDALIPRAGAPRG